MKVAIFGATSNIASDVIKHFSNKNIEIDLYARSINSAIEKISKIGVIKANYLHFSAFNAKKVYDVIINFIGLGCPKKIKKATNELVSVSNFYDNMILDYLTTHSKCKYIFISSGAVYGENFMEPIPENGKTTSDDLASRELSSYALSKITCEKRHRNYPNLAIVDLRIFSYFNSGYDPNSQFFMSQICNAIRDKEVLIVSADKMVRDYIHPIDFCSLVDIIITSPPINIVIDCHSNEPIEKIALLESMKKEFGLRYIVKDQAPNQSIFTSKTNYYSLLSNAKKIGYKPNYSSLEALIHECKKIFPENSEE